MTEYWQSCKLISSGKYSNVLLLRPLKGLDKGCLNSETVLLASPLCTRECYFQTLKFLQFLFLSKHFILHTIYTLYTSKNQGLVTLHSLTIQ